tara:strand:+ start:10233 stop:10637 length:405 start_codon:yes stop_codon:yes gene_type:complete
MKLGISTITFICEYHGCNNCREEAITKYKTCKRHYCSRTCAALDQKKLTDLPGSEHLTLKETAAKYNLTYSCLVSRRHEFLKGNITIDKVYSPQQPRRFSKIADADNNPPKKYFYDYMPVLPYKSNPGYRERGW